MLVDFHAHTARCNHATGTLDEYIERARALGLAELGFSDHSYWMLQDPGRHLAMWPEETAKYVADVRRAQARHDRDGEHPFHVRLGLEMDYIPSRLEAAREVIGAYEWDFLIGSIHNIGLWGINDPDELENFKLHHIEDICELYFHMLGQMVRERYCDVIAHLDLPKKFGHRPPGGFLRWIEPLIPAIKESGMAVEINTSGRDYPAGEIFPSWEVVETLVEAGVPLTLGSDAHAPEQVGRYFPEVLKNLRCLGVREIARFERRRIIMAPLDEGMRNAD
jgi:histidinol-phosphatase (PHP family)